MLWLLFGITNGPASSFIYLARVWDSARVPILLNELPLSRKFVIVDGHGAYRKGWVKHSRTPRSAPLTATATAVVCHRMGIPFGRCPLFEKVFMM